MYKEFNEILSGLDKKILNLDSKELQKEFENIPLDIFGRIQIEQSQDFPNLLHWFPKMPSVDIQKSWTGAANNILLKQSISFIRIVVSAYHSMACKPISQGNILDFGCGWGRLIRLLYKYVPDNNIYGVDPWDKSIEICQKTNLHGNFFISEYVPRSLPTPNNLKFDFIMAFSVFTHLSEKVTKICSKTLKNYLTNNGVMAITIRPREYWTFLYKNSNISSGTLRNSIINGIYHPV